MAKRQAKATSKPTAPSSELPGKVRFEVRFDDDVYQGIKKLADEAQISVNQLMHALARWAAQNAKAGEPELDENGVWRGQIRKQPGTVMIGLPATTREMNAAELEFYARTERMSVDTYVEVCGAEALAWKGKTWTFDFTERRVIREDV